MMSKQRRAALWLVLVLMELEGTERKAERTAE